MSVVSQIVRNRPQRLALALGVAAILAWIGTFVLIKVGAGPIVIALLGLVLAVGVLMQTLSPGTGISTRRTVDRGGQSPLLPGADLDLRLQEMASARAQGQPPFALVLLELEPVRGTEPDALTRIAARRLEAAVRHGDYAAQVGALSFAVVLGLGESDRLELYAAGVRLANAVSGGSREGRPLTASFGFAMHQQGMTLESLFRQATDALEANRSGGGRVGVYRRFSRGPARGASTDPKPQVE